MHGTAPRSAIWRCEGTTRCVERNTVTVRCRARAGSGVKEPLRSYFCTHVVDSVRCIYGDGFVRTRVSDLLHAIRRASAVRSVTTRILL